MPRIVAVSAREVLDSRGFPTVEAEVELEGGARARAIVPSGASTGEKEAVELRDDDRARYQGKGVRHAVANVNGELAAAVKGHDAADQRALDATLIATDGSPHKGRLGANALLAVSMAAARACAVAQGRPLYQHLAQLAGGDGVTLPVPCMNVLNGGRHADNNVDFQEFMIAPLRADRFSEAIRVGMECFHALKAVLRKHGYSTAVGDEGGFAPDLKSNREAIDLILEAIRQAGYEPGRDIALCLDPAASELWDDGKYVLFKSTREALSSDQMVRHWETWANEYPIVSLEDGMGENDRAGWKALTSALGSRLELVGDDLFCTNADLLRQGIRDGLANSILIKLNQIGTVTETLDTMQLARENRYGCFVSHRSGETEDTFIADLAVATDAGKIKTGSGCRSERVAKFNQLLRIEEQLGGNARFASWRALA